jgi:hypothetical protein
MTTLLCPSVELALVGPKGRGWTEAPYAKCGDCRLVFADEDLTYNYGADDWLCPACLHAPNPCRIDGCSGHSVHPGGACPDCNRAFARLGREF